MKNFNWKNKNVLITGIHGFVGSNLAKSLIKNGANVYGIHKFNSNNSLLKIEKIIKFNSIQINDSKNDNLNLITDLLYDKEIEICFHLAAQVEVSKAHNNPYQTIDNNINLTLNLLEAARNSSFIKSFILCSTDKVYGEIDKKKLPYKEFYTPKPLYPYEISKYSCELIAKTYFHTYNVPIITTRTSNIYGPGQLNFSALIPDVICSIKKNYKFIPRSNGMQERDYLYIDDWIYYLKKLVEKSYSKKIFGELYNFGNGEPFTSYQIVKEIHKIMKSKNFAIIERKFKKFKKNNEINFQSMDMTKAKKIISQKKTSLNKGLNNTIRWYEKYIL